METGVSYYGNRILHHVRADMEDIASNHCTYVNHCFSENDLSFYKDTMKKIVALTRDAGLAVQLGPWGVAGIFGGEAFSRFVAINTEARQVTSNGRLAPAACPNHPDTQTFLREWIDAAAYCGADRAFWDEPHFFNGSWDTHLEDEWCCVCPTCRDLYRHRTGKKMPEPGEAPAEMPVEVGQFQDDRLMELFEDLCDYARQKGMGNSLCVLPHIQDAQRGAWDKLAGVSALDSIGTDPYWWRKKPQEMEEHWETMARPATRLLKAAADRSGKQAHYWVQTFCIRKGREGDVVTAVRIAEEEGIRDIAAWSYWGGCSMSRLWSEDGEGIWRVLGREYKRLREAYDTH